MQIPTITPVQFELNLPEKRPDTSAKQVQPTGGMPEQTTKTGTDEKLEPFAEFAKDPILHR